MSDFYFKKLVPFADEIIRNNLKFTSYGYEFDYHSLDDSDKQELAAMFLEYDDRDIYSIYENENLDDIVSKLILMLRKDSTDNKLEFAEVVSKNLVKHYEKPMISLLIERLSYIEDDNYAESGYVKRFHKDNGEMYRAAV